MRHTQQLKRLLARRAAVTIPGAANALFARVIEDQGFEAVYVTGAGIAINLQTASAVFKGDLTTAGAFQRNIGKH